MHPTEAPALTNPAPAPGRAIWRSIALVAAVLAVAVLGYSLARYFVQPPIRHGMPVQSPQPVADFTLTGSQGEAVRLSDLRGKYLLVFFGYTYCPDVCPATLGVLTQALQRLGARAAKVQVILITVDPGRDTPQRLATYLSQFDRSFMGLTGTPEALVAATTSFGIYYGRQAADAAGNYTVDHTATVTLLDPDGYLRALFPFGLSPQELASDLAILVR